MVFESRFLSLSVAFCMHMENYYKRFVVYERHKN